ncbi:hypothetical protein GCM10027346_20720 [Hymenobacter seoulensis]
MLKRLFLFGLLTCLSCATERPIPPLLRPLNLDSLERVAQLPPYLVPPPAQATPKQAEAWRDSQVKMLGNVGAPARKVKLKNVGNTDDHSSVKSGITGGQITTAVIVLGVLALLLWLGPRFLRGGL